MKISKLIKDLKAVQKNVGNVEVMVYSDPEGNGVLMLGDKLRVYMSGPTLIIQPIEKFRVE